MVKVCTCIWLTFIIDIHNNVNTSADIKFFNDINSTDQVCEGINEYCKTRNSVVRGYVDCQNNKKSDCTKMLDEAEEHFEEQIKKLLSKARH